MKNKISWRAIALSSIFCLIGLSYWSFTDSVKRDLEEKRDLTRKAVTKIESPLPQIVKGIRLDQEYHLAGEYIPRNNWDAMERLDREFMVNSYWHSSTLIHLKRAQRYFPIIEKILREEGVPDDFKYLAVAESSLDNVTSPAGAKGIWQIMRPTAKGYGLEVSKTVDERYHVEKATRAACKLLKDYFKRFGNWTMAAGAYNMGETRMAKEMRLQKESSYYNLNLGRETGRYVFRILAIKYIFQDPSYFGFFPGNINSYYKPLTDYSIISVDKSIPSLAEFAHTYGTTYRMLKRYNPWLITDRLDVGPGQLYKIHIPRKTSN